MVPGFELPEGMSLSEGGVLSGVPRRAGSYGITATATDAGGNVVTIDFSWRAVALQIRIPAQLGPARSDSLFTAQLEAAGSVPPYRWAIQEPACFGLHLSPEGWLSGIPRLDQASFCYVTVTDAVGHTASDSFEIYVYTPGPPDPLRISGPITGNTGVASYFWSYLSVCCAWSIQVEPSAGSELPPGLRITGTTLSGYPALAGRYAFELQATDGLGQKASGNAYIAVSPLHIVPIVPAGVYNQPYRYQFRILEHVEPLLWTVNPQDRLPAGLSLSPDGLLSGTPRETGTFSFTVRANDAVAAVQLHIGSGGGYALTANHEGPIAATVGARFSHLLTAYFSESLHAVTLASGSLPPGLELAANGDVSGTPTTAGVYTFTIRLEDDEGDFGFTVFTIRVGGPQDETRYLQSGTVGKPYTARLRSGTLAAGDSLPDGLTLAADGTLSGTPTTQWLYRFTTLVTDAAGGPVTSTYTLEITK
jgi:hypothetical protein